MRPHFPKKPYPAEAFIFLVSAVSVLLGNASFFLAFRTAYPAGALSPGIYFSVGILILSCTNFFLGSLCWGRLTKPILALFLVLTAILAYATDSLGMVADESMVLNLLKTDPAEVRDLLTFRLAAYLAVVAALPGIAIFGLRQSRPPLLRALAQRGIFLAASVLVIVPTLILSSGFFASFFREHKNLRSYINPTHFLYSAGKFASARMDASAGPPKPIDKDARVPASDKKRDLIILVVGETARADHFSLNGYGKETNPRLRAEGAISFSNVWSCGTSTAVSVPCMFSSLGQPNYSDKAGRENENVLDLLHRTGDVKMIWRDNNSDSKGVADRIGTEDFKTSARNPVCDEECRDIGMLSGLQEIFDAEERKDILIVLHQMGNHGPAYYRRYPASFEKFRPACHTNDLNQCTQEEISNAYDNALLYTDFFLGEVINLLKKNSVKFETAMLYMSDHGESLGERGVYLHGLPYLIAPEAQKRPAAAAWIGSKAGEISVAKLRAKAHLPLSHDNLFHSLLGLFEIESKAYRPELDLFHP